MVMSRIILLLAFALGGSATTGFTRRGTLQNNNAFVSAKVGHIESSHKSTSGSCGFGMGVSAFIPSANTLFLRDKPGSSTCGGSSKGADPTKSERIAHIVRMSSLDADDDGRLGVEKVKPSWHFLEQEEIETSRAYISKKSRLFYLQRLQSQMLEQQRLREETERRDKEERLLAKQAEAQHNVLAKLLTVTSTSPILAGVREMVTKTMKFFVSFVWIGFFHNVISLMGQLGMIHRPKPVASVAVSQTAPEQQLDHQSSENLSPS